MASRLLLHRASNHSASVLLARNSLLSSASSAAYSYTTPSSLLLPQPGAASAIASKDTEAYTEVGRRFFSSLRPNYRSRCVHSHARTLLWIMHQRDWDSDLEGELAESGISLTENIVDQVVGCLPSGKLALQFFIWAGEQIGFPPPTSKSACDITRWYARKPQMSPFMCILRCLHRPQFHLSPAKVNVMIQGYGWAGMLDRAYNLVVRVKGFSDVILVKCLLYAVVKQHRYDVVLKVYMEMKKCGTPLDVCYNYLIYGMSFAKDEEWQQADLIFKQMVDSGQFPDTAACNALVRSLCKAGKVERAYEMLEEMIRRKISLEIVTANAMVECLCHVKQLQRAEKLIEEMRQRHVRLFVNVYEIFSKASRNADIEEEKKE